MLQIISGKFFDSEKRFHNECKIVLYSNAHFHGNHKFAHISFDSTELNSDIATYVVSYDNQLEMLRTSLQPIKVGNEEIAYQIMNILSFALNCIIGKDKDTVEKLCALPISGIRDAYTPSAFIPLTADKKRDISDEELERANILVERIIGLSRRDYLNVLHCIIAYNESIQHLSTDISLAYSMLVYSLESLAQKYDQYEATWNDYNQNMKSKLERAFQEVDNGTAEKIKNILIADGHFKLSQRFKNFVISNIKNSFFCGTGERHVISKEDLLIALSNAYTMRSQYAHMLEPIMKLLTDGPFSQTHDTLEFQHNVYFTYSGLLRTAKEVIVNFIYSQPQLESEAINWYYQLPGSIEAELAPYYWIWKLDSPIGVSSKAKFEGFIELIISYSNHLPQMDQLVIQYLTHLHEMDAENKAAAFSLCWLYYSLINNIDVGIKKQMTEMINKNKGLSGECNIYTLVAIELVSTLPISIEWTTENVENAVIKYRKRKYKKSSLKLPVVVELLLYIRMANLFRDENNYEKRNEWLKIAYDNSNNFPIIQQEINKCFANTDATQSDTLLQLVFGSKSDPEKSE